MRPIVLEMDGFASFREPARIDFTDAEFFALVGPTGSGKSTVIDAMTFALYGSVPRWGRKGMVSLALAPTTTRGTVKLVFEVEGQRYVVARELRRIGGQVNQRAASLERLARPVRPGRAGGAAHRCAGRRPGGRRGRRGTAARPDLRRLLPVRGAPAGPVRQLPARQGQRPAGDPAPPARRRALQADDDPGEPARQRSGEASRDPERDPGRLWRRHPGGAGRRARQRRPRWAWLSERVAAVTPRIHAADQGLSAAEAELEGLEADRAALAAVHIPDDVATLDADLAGARAALAEAERTEQEALDADSAARAALAGAPEPGAARTRPRAARRAGPARRGPAAGAG